MTTFGDFVKAEINRAFRPEFRSEVCIDGPLKGTVVEMPWEDHRVFVRRPVKLTEAGEADPHDHPHGYIYYLVKVRCSGGDKIKFVFLTHKTPENGEYYL